MIFTILLECSPYCQDFHYLIMIFTFLSGFSPSYQNFHHLIRIFTILSGFSKSFKYFTIFQGYTLSSQDFLCLLNGFDHSFNLDKTTKVIPTLRGHACACVHAQCLKICMLLWACKILYLNQIKSDLHQTQLGLVPDGPQRSSWPWEVYMIRLKAECGGPKAHHWYFSQCTFISFFRYMYNV